MSTEELMKVRYKVIAAYPEIERHNIRVGDIITIEEKTIYADKTQDGTPVVAIDHKMFTSNFKKLEWWEERKESDMPEYVYDNARKYFFKIEEWNMKQEVAHPDYSPDRYGGFLHLSNTSPATKEEYENQHK